ncbi:tRNA threonylcarbamoyladenosine dehydratase [Sphingobacterium sp. PCS056]|jgi:tRNA A37 threonylcarbamoyladenosine dehydratase|uniref:tRNA threonylcarbamoyladenosine dehydratase n=1 Tax=Sphingobacterium TaxID=28453 RepID=UPI00097EDF5A|nr:MULTISPECIES: tRNA threonylcarbamoyladenosine dehydratase [Sphingobacterium]UZJ64583.1 tRNA threonylcarbamoyladenosine dehydratase [Sphingobacterium sp. KU25419]SJN43413.1 Molybdopterin biosynthesis protein MoeB [Sphingobacterium faecium PCAi_F2.5]PTX10105.1 tRNA A37 threonylcarbamoyladenosine dehydratase [Sphingobacterium faecium]UPZ35464.1 tRNA threonylcarbamoyladenosine dehydratase [Sphingobacterium sp. PCS056]UXD71021.1 tRNA threonylcarbamoyladenosine dehydratase [Sphingobacterium faeci
MKDLSWLSRTEALVGREALEKLANSHVMVLGLGGVGSFAAEFICRGGVGKMTIIDGDTVDPSNRNRQLPALATNHGMSKAQIMRDRLLAINPELDLTIIEDFVLPEKISDLLDLKPDYAVEAIDSITPKLFFIRQALERKVRFVSSMGAGGKMDPTKIEIADIGETYNCKLAHHIRKKLYKHGIRSGFKAVFSTELPDKASLLYTDGSNYKKSAYGTMSYLPAAFGGAIASVALRDLIAKN